MFLKLFNSRGAVFLGLILVLSICAILTAGLVSTNTSDFYSGVAFSSLNQAQYLAEFGLRFARAQNLPDATPRTYILDNGDTVEISVSNCTVRSTALARSGSPFESLREIEGDYIRPEEGVVVDDADAGFSVVGSWTETTSNLAYACKFVYASVDGDTASWNPVFPQTGNYEVYVRWPLWSNPATNVPYTIDHSAGTDTVRLDQSADAGDWVLLGTFPFNAGATGTVTVTREAGDGGATMADAAKFLWVG